LITEELAKETGEFPAAIFRATRLPVRTNMSIPPYFGEVEAAATSISHTET
jgi:hypothetical protein